MTLVTARQQRDQVAEHVTGRWETMQQEEHRCIGGTCIAVEDVDLTDCEAAIMDGGHDELLQSR